MRSHKKFTNSGPPPNQKVKNLFFFAVFLNFYLLGKVPTIHYVHASEKVPNKLTRNDEGKLRLRIYNKQQQFNTIFSSKLHIISKSTRHKMFLKDERVTMPPDCDHVICQMTKLQSKMKKYRYLLASHRTPINKNRQQLRAQTRIEQNNLQTNELNDINNAPRHNTTYTSPNKLKSNSSNSYNSSK